VSDPVPYVAPYKAHEIEAGRCDPGRRPGLRAGALDGPARKQLAGDGRPLWLVPLTGEGTIDGADFPAGTVWMIEGGAALSLADGADLLVAYPGAVNHRFVASEPEDRGAP
jgi:mannose-6-phosphate isomerase